MARLDILQDGAPVGFVAEPDDGKQHRLFKCTQNGRHEAYNVVLCAYGNPKIAFSKYCFVASLCDQGPQPQFACARLSNLRTRNLAEP